MFTLYTNIYYMLLIIYIIHIYTYILYIWNFIYFNFIINTFPISPSLTLSLTHTLYYTILPYPYRQIGTVQGAYLRRHQCRRDACRALPRTERRSDPALPHGRYLGTDLYRSDGQRLVVVVVGIGLGVVEIVAVALVVVVVAGSSVVVV